MKVEILYVTGCPHADRAGELITRALTERGLKAEVDYRLVSDAASAPGAFAGSPTILINGRDVEPAETTGIACRIYSNGKGCPPLEVLQRAVALAVEGDA